MPGGEIDNTQLATIIAAVLVTHGAAIVSGIWFAVKFAVARIIEYHGMQRDILENKRMQEVRNEQFQKDIDRLTKDVNAAFTKIRSK